MRTPKQIWRDRLSGEDVAFLPIVLVVTILVAFAAYIVTQAIWGWAPRL